MEENGVINANVNPSEPTIVKTDDNQKIGQDKCPQCGATEISLNVATGKLRCHFCRHEFEPEKTAGFVEDLGSLTGTVMGSGMSDISDGSENLITLKCSSCASEVVVDTTSNTQARCHWCRNTLSINQQVPNGAVPDVILPFKVAKDDANKQIKTFVDKRKFFANTKFQEEFKLDNVMGVYFPYAIVDLNTTALFSGKGEHLIHKYYRGSGNNKRVYYDADLYNVQRQFDLTINNLTLESSKDKLDTKNNNKTNNVINAIMPFDTENSIKFNSNYMKGYTSEKRDSNIDDLKPLVDIQAKDVARHSCNSTLQFYDRGVAWEQENLNIKGSQWKTAYLPVWVYSYQEVKGAEKILHYVVVNARTKETMGSIPINVPKLLLFSFLVEILGFFLMFFIDFDYDFLFLSSGVVFYITMYAKYRNSNARHTYEKETKSTMTNLLHRDDLIKRKKGLTKSKIEGVNNNFVAGQSSESKSINNIVENSVVSNIIDANNDNKSG